MCHLIAIYVLNTENSNLDRSLGTRISSQVLPSEDFVHMPSCDLLFYCLGAAVSWHLSCVVGCYLSPGDHKGSQANPQIVILAAPLSTRVSLAAAGAKWSSASSKIVTASPKSLLNKVDKIVGENAIFKKAGMHPTCLVYTSPSLASSEAYKPPMNSSLPSHGFTLQRREDHCSHGVPPVPLRLAPRRLCRCPPSRGHRSVSDGRGLLVSLSAALICTLRDAH